MPDSNCADCAKGTTGGPCSTCGSEPGSSPSESVPRIDASPDETEAYGPVHFGMFLVVTGFLALALRVFPAMNRVPEDPDVMFVPPRVLGIYVAVAGIAATAVGISTRIKMRGESERWNNHSETTASIVGGMALVAITFGLSAIG